MNIKEIIKDRPTIKQTKARNEYQMYLELTGIMLGNKTIGYVLGRIKKWGKNKPLKLKDRYLEAQKKTEPALWWNSRNKYEWSKSKS